MILARQKKIIQSAGAGVGGAMALSTVAGIPLIPAMQQIKKTRFGHPDFPQETSRLMDSFMKKHKIYPTTITHSHDLKSPMFLPKSIAGRMGINPGVHTPTTQLDPSIYLHELGHATDYKKFPKTKLLGRKLLGLAGLGAGIGLAASDDPEKRKWAPAAVIAGATPTLYQEGKASLLALRHLGQESGAKGVLKGLKHLAPAYASYLALPAGAALGLAWLNRRRNQAGKINLENQHNKR